MPTPDEVKLWQAEYLAWKRYKNLSSESVRADKTILAQYIEFPLHEWVSIYYMRAAKVKAVTIARQLGRIQTFLDWCIKRGYLNHHPFEKIEKPKIPKTLPRTLTRLQIEELIDLVSKHSLQAKAVFCTFLYTGLRKKELLTLEIEHVNLRERYIVVLEGKGGKSRYVPIHGKLIPLLQAWIDSRKDHRYFFCMSDITLRRLKEKIQRLLTFDFNIHQLRHTAATMMLRAGIDIYTVAAILGHSDIKVTTIYLSVDVRHTNKEIDKLDF